MTSIELVGRIEKYLSQLDGNTYLFETLRAIVEEGRKLFALAFIPPTHGDNASMSNSANEARKAIQQARRTLGPKIKISKFVKSIDALEAAVTALYPSETESSNIPSEFAALIQTFRDAFDTYADSYNEAATLNMCRAAEILLTAIGRDQETLRAVLNNLRPKDNAEPQYEPVSFHFEDDLTLKDIADKIGALVNLYGIFCALLDVDPDTHPLRLVKIETGTLDINVSGWAAVIFEMIPCLFETTKVFVGYYQSSDTKRMLDQVISVFVIDRLRKRAKEQGLDTAKLDQNAQRLYNAFGDNLLSFVKSKRISVNGKVATEMRFLPGPAPAAPPQQRRLTSE